MRALKQVNVDVGVLQETKLTDRIHMRQGLRRLVDSGGYQALGGSSGSLEGRCRVAGGGHRQLRPKRGKLLAEVGIAEIVRRQGVNSPKRRAICPSRRTGIVGSSKENGGNTVREPKRKAEVNARQQGRRYSNSAGGQRAG